LAQTGRIAHDVVGYQFLLSLGRGGMREREEG
jgi:hypothetical protein